MYKLLTIHKDLYCSNTWLFEVIPPGKNEAGKEYIGAKMAQALHDAEILLYPDESLKKGAKHIFSILSGTLKSKPEDFQTF